MPRRERARQIALVPQDTAGSVPIQRRGARADGPRRRISASSASRAAHDLELARAALARMGIEALADRSVLDALGRRATARGRGARARPAAAPAAARRTDRLPRPAPPPRGAVGGARARDGRRAARSSSPTTSRSRRASAIASRCSAAAGILASGPPARGARTRIAARGIRDRSRDPAPAATAFRWWCPAPSRR